MKSQYKYQQGVVLVVALVMLLVMTSVGVTLMSGATLQERMASNNRELFLARMNAEGALRQAELAIANMDILTTPNTTPEEVIATEFNPASDGRFVDLEGNVAVPSSPSEFIVSDELTDDLSESTSWTTGNSVSAGATSTSSTAPRYTIEYIGRLDSFALEDGIDVSDEAKGKQRIAPYAFRITAIGFGANDEIYSVLQSVYSTAVSD